ncbi:MAG TPA: DUF3280 domain-containing protein [Dongiaceae bacterium]|nr:DUF3280 domain-containing protein [Dongiaceae bacterium]
MVMRQRQAGRGGIADRAGARCRAMAGFLLCAVSLIAVPADAAAPATVKIAIFDFELDDFSAAASAAGVAPSDAAQLADVTREVRKVFEQSGRYRLVDTGNMDAAAAKTHTLHECDGCEAGIALKLGAEQSFIGIVKRISRTEYMVKFQIRDARTGALVSEADSGLRMGADYSWSRGATRLIKDRLLGSARQ